LAKNPTEIMEILASYDLTRTAWSAAQLVGCAPKTVQRYVDLRDAGLDPFRRTRRARLIDPHLEKVEELVEDSRGKIRADVVHDRLRAMGFAGNERTTRRAVAAAKKAYRAGRRRTYRPWLPEPGRWLQFDWADGPRVNGRETSLFCAWLAWSRFRVVLPTWDRKLGTLLSCLDATLRRLDGAPPYVLTDNERTVTTDRVAGVPVRHPVLVAAGRHYGVEVRTCEVADPESKGGSEATVRIAKADLVPTEANLLPAYGAFGELVEACERLCDEMNERPHSETKRAPTDALAEERDHLHVLPREPYTAALGETRSVDDDQTIRWGSVRYSTPPGWVGEQVWCRVEGEELVIVGAGEQGLVEVWRHQLSVPGRPQILDEHYPDHPNGRAIMQPRLRPQREEERVFLAIGEGAERWLREAAASGATRVRAKMAQAVELALLSGSQQVDEALRRAADAGRFGEDDLVSILTHAQRNQSLHVVHADESFSAQPGTSAWEGFGRRAS
jgi:transposase